MEPIAQNVSINNCTDKESKEAASESMAGGMIEQAVVDALKSIEIFIKSWEVQCGKPAEYVFYRVVDALAQYDLRLSDLRKVEEVLKAIGEPTRCQPLPALPRRRRQNLTDEERERRRKRMKDYWGKKRAEAAEQAGDVEARGQADA